MTAVGAPQTKKTEMRIAAANERLEAILHPRVHGPVGVSEALVVDPQEFLEMVFDNVFEVVGGGSRSIACGGVGGRGHAGGVIGSSKGRVEAWGGVGQAELIVAPSAHRSRKLSRGEVRGEAVEGYRGVQAGEEEPGERRRGDRGLAEYRHLREVWQ